jgi:exoribonuclease R
LNEEDLMPRSFRLEERNEAMFIVEECMLLANKLVAEKIVASCREVAVLRHHPFPSRKKQQFLEELCQSMQVSINFANTLTLNESLRAIMES